MENAELINYSNFDRFVRALQARLTFSISPAALMLAFFDWAIHLANSPGKQWELMEQLARDLSRFHQYVPYATIDSGHPPCQEPSPQDKRFKNDEWQQWPFSLIYQAFLMTENWWQSATTGVSGVSEHHQNVVSFVTRQLLDIFAPSNYLFTNPEVLRITREQSGFNLLSGWFNFLEDVQRVRKGEKPFGTENFRVGEEVGVTPGKVIFRNELIELIQYSPTTEEVYAEPLLIVPAWIMKYYILDLSPHNSLVKYLVDKGHTVFMISWKNPRSEDANLGLDDYRTLGVMAAIDAISSVVPDKRIHSLGYCIGGTLLTIAAATMARDNDDRLQSMSLLAAQTDFTEAGELMLFIDESQVNYLEDVMWSQGYLDTKQMAGAFQLLHSNYLIWSQVIHEYLMGDRQPMFDLMAWNADATRMPYKMHSEYLRKLFLKNELFEGHYEVNGRPIVISDIRIPVFLVSTIKDHVAPWRSVYKFHFCSDASEVTFILTSGGHNAGIVSEPGHEGRTYQISTTREGEKYVDPDTWRSQMPVHEGSWWPAWQEWVASHSTGKMSPPSMGAPEKGLPPIVDAPGTYVLQD